MIEWAAIAADPAVLSVSGANSGGALRGGVHVIEPDQPARRHESVERVVVPNLEIIQRPCGFSGCQVNRRAGQRHDAKLIRDVLELGHDLPFPNASQFDAETL